MEFFLPYMADFNHSTGSTVPKIKYVWNGVCYEYTVARFMSHNNNTCSQGFKLL